MMQVAILLNVMRYMPVADETLGGTFIAIRIGLKMTPPPRPSAPAIHPPKNPKDKMIVNVLPSKIKSLCARLMPPWRRFKSYS